MVVKTVGLVAGLAMLVSASAVARAADPVYGAIATSRHYGGSGTNAASEDAAKAAAVEDCKAHLAAANVTETCVVRITFAHCAVVAWDDHGTVAAALGDSEAEAKKAALAKLGKSDADSDSTWACNAV